MLEMDHVGTDGQQQIGESSNVPGRRGSMPAPIVFRRKIQELILAAVKPGNAGSLLVKRRITVVGAS